LGEANVEVQDILPEDHTMTMEYLIYCACERFGILPSEFRQIRRGEQLKMLAFEQIRQVEEIRKFQVFAAKNSMR
jgi:hypothetical protein